MAVVLSAAALYVVASPLATRWTTPRGVPALMASTLNAWLRAPAAVSVSLATVPSRTTLAPSMETLTLVPSSSSRGTMGESPTVP